MARIAAYNCQQSHHRAVDFLSNRVQDGVDAACTQESGTRMNLGTNITTTPGFMGAEAFADDPCVVVIQTTDRVSLQETIAIRAGLSENRSALLVKLKSGLIVVNVHLTSGNPKRAKAELQQIHEHLKENHSGKPWVVIGDFNHNPTSAFSGGSVEVVRGPKHQGGHYLDWAIAGNVTSISANEYPRYHGADHGPWYVDVDF